jgi:anti-sigma-K factor RskA
MSADRMTLERLQAILDAYGTSPARWPAAERAAATALLERSEAARAMLAAAADLDRLLDSAPTLTPSPELHAVVLARAPRAGVPARLGLAARWRDFVAGLGGWRLAGPVLAASLVLGIVSGGWLARQAAAEAPPDLLALAQLDDSVAEY